MTRHRDKFKTTVILLCGKATTSSPTAHKRLQRGNSTEKGCGSKHTPSQWTKIWLIFFHWWCIVFQLC